MSFLKHDETRSSSVSGASNPARKPSSHDEVISIGCGSYCCLPSFYYWRRGQNATNHLRRRRRRRSTIYHDTQTGSSISNENDHRMVLQVRSSQFFFFNARQNDDDDDDDDVYPNITTSYVVPPPPRRVSLQEPESLLLCSKKENEADQQEENHIIPTNKAHHHHHHHRRRTKRRHSLLQLRRSMLEQPKVKGFVERGYPGQLNAVELEECLKLYHKLQEDFKNTSDDDHHHDDDAVLYDMVYKFRQVEDVPYALCRFLRSTKFQTNKLVKKLQAVKEDWKQAAKHDFYPDPANALGVPMPIFLQMYPFVYYGNAKNGCPVSYLRAGHIQTEGMASVTTVERMRAFFWHSFAHTLVQQLERAKALHPNFCRAEFIQVTDLKGISRAQCTADALQVIQMSAQVGECFPETLHGMILLNAPSWFSVVWRMITAFLDPRLARMIEVYSSESRGRERLLELVDTKEIPLDFGGTGPCMDQCIQREQHCYQEQQQQQEQKDDTCSAISKNQRVAVKLVNLQRRHNTSQRIELCQLNEAESASIEVYTKSITGASFQVFRGSEQINIERVVVCRKEIQITEFSKENPPTPFCTTISLNIVGPVKITVELEDLGDFPTPRKRFSHEYFLVAATIEEN